jgi:hypothetical protein
MFNLQKEDIITYFSPIPNTIMHLHGLVVHFLQILLFNFLVLYLRCYHLHPDDASLKLNNNTKRCQ